VKGHFIRVDTVTGEARLLPPNTTVFVGNISFGSTKMFFFLDFIHPFLDAHEDSIREFFASCGAVVAVRVIRERSQPLHKGVAYVSFMVR
jgi:RNA recognition motif-containing protein